MNNKQKYHQLCEQETSIPIFSRDWWLDAVCGEENWDVALHEKGGQIVATFPYYVRKKALSLTVISMPSLTPFMGPWLRYPTSMSDYDRPTYEKQTFTDLIEQLPKFDYFNQSFHYSIVNWLPFYWKGFQQTTYYTYSIDDLTDLDAVFGRFSHSKRKNIKKAEKIVTVKFDLSAEDFYRNHEMTLQKQGKMISYSFDLFERIYGACYIQNAGRTIYAVDSEGNIHSALFVIWDERSAYDLISTIDPDFRESGSATLLIKEMIKYVAQKTERFDFEGSMIEGVEQSFRRFGTLQKPYFNLQKINSKSLKIVDFIRHFKR